MPVCIQCNSEVIVPCITREPQGLPANAIIVPSDWELGRISYFWRLAIALLNLKARDEISRRRIADWLAETIFFHAGPILWPDGRIFLTPETLIDDAFNNDGSFRWLSDFMRFAEKPPKQCPQERVLDRLRIISLAFQIAHPSVARHFCR